MKKLSAAQIKVGNSWLYDIFWLAGKRQKQDPDYCRRIYHLSDGSTPDTIEYFINMYHKPGLDTAVDAAKKLCSAMIFRDVDYKAFKYTLDPALEVMSKCTFMKLGRLGTTIYQWTAEEYAACIANYCASHQIYWDDAMKTPEELTEIRKTIIGDALATYRCFRTQPITPSGSASSQAKGKGYKASMGALSGKISNLIGQPGHKASPASIMFCIEGTDPQNTQLITPYIEPILRDGTAVGKTQAESIKIGKPNGYVTCKLWWDKENKADDFLQALLNLPKLAGDKRLAYLHIAKAKAQPNGYFKVSTECGDAYIKASALNEELFEDCENGECRPSVRPDNSIRDIDTFSEAFYRFD